MVDLITINSTKVFNFLKLLGAVLIFYFGFKLGVCNIGEDVDLLKNKYYEEMSSINLEYNEDWSTNIGIHNVSKNLQNGKTDLYDGNDGENKEFELKYQALCLSNPDICEKIIFKGNLSAKDKFMYAASTIYVVDLILKNLQIGGNFGTQLKKITINSDYGTTRGSADWSTVSIHLGAVSSYVEYLGLISHELGHIVDLGVIQGYSNKKSQEYTEFGQKVFGVDDPSLAYYSLSWDSENVRKSTATKDDFCSGYGMTDPFEDFAECHNMYLNHNDLFRKWATVNDVLELKYNFFANIYGGKYLFSSNSDLVMFESNNSWRPWDTTKM